MHCTPPRLSSSPHSSSSSILQNVRWSGYAGVAVSAMKEAFTQYNLTSLSSQVSGGGRGRVWGWIGRRKFQLAEL